MSNTKTRKEQKYDAVSLMAVDDPIAVYSKSRGFIGKLNVKVFNSLTGEIEDIIVEGIPGKDDSCLVEIWSEKEHVFFKRANRYHLNEGHLIPFNKPRSKEIKRTPNNISDEEIEEVVNKPFMALKALVDRMTTEPALLRVISIAEEAERPEKTMQYLRERLSLIQSGEVE